MTWDDIYERAEGTGFGSYELKSKDEARFQVAEAMRELGYPDPEKEEIPEECIDDFCNKLKMEFDITGNIIGIQLPARFEEMIYRRKADEYLKEDIIAMAGDMAERGEISFAKIDRDVIREMISRSHKRADCNIPYNDTLEYVIKEVMEDMKNGKSN